MELFLSSGTVCLSLYSLVAAIFGMNIPYTWNDNHGFMFKWVCKSFQLVDSAIIFWMKFFQNIEWSSHLGWQVIIVTGLCCAFLFLLIVSYARVKGLVGSWIHSYMKHSSLNTRTIAMCSVINYVPLAPSPEETFEPRSH